jgi:hypothetical protein
MNVGAAWNLLKTNIKTVDISATVPVNTILSGFLATPGMGTGYLRPRGRERWPATPAVHLHPHKRPAAPVTYNVSWVDNDGTFSSAGSVSCRRTSPSPSVNINPATAWRALGHPQPG